MTYKRSMRSWTHAFGVLVVALSVIVAGVVALSPSASAAQFFPGSGRELRFADGKLIHLYALKAPKGGDGSVPVFCVDVNAESPDPATDPVTSVATLTQPTGHAPADLSLTTPQMAWVLEQYQMSQDANTLAALAYLVHANFEDSKPGGRYGSRTSAQNVAWLVSEVKANFPELHNLAVKMVNEGRASAAIGYEGGAVTGDGQRTGTIHNIGVHPIDGNAWLPNIPFTVTLNGPAVFADTGTTTYSGTTQSQPITLTWKATGNGEITSVTRYNGRIRKTLTYYGSLGGVQGTLTTGNRPVSDPEESDEPGPSWRVIYDFQPRGTSQVQSQEVNYTGEIRDVLTTAVDKNYGSGSWISGDDGVPVEVTYHASAFLSRTKPAEAERVPEGAEKIGEVALTANGEGQRIEAKLSTAKRGWVTWVWEVRRDAQPDPQLVHANWNDHFGLDAETSKENFDFKPMGVSNVKGAKVIKSSTPPSDTFIPNADPNYRDGEWTRIINGNVSFDEGTYVPVVYTATAYRVDPETLFPTVSSTPADAQVLGSVKVTATAPGKEITATLPNAVEPGFVYWVWSVDAADQGENAKWIASGWRDSFALADETTSVQYDAEIDSTLSIRKTKSGTYLVDDVWVLGMPENHPNFYGGYGFREDEQEMTHRLLFFPEGEAVTDENVDAAQVIASVSLPAKNGFYPSVGATKFKLKGEDVPGTYVFQTVFAGDDRVRALTTSVEDTTEQYVVSNNKKPELHTTAQSPEGGKVLDPTQANVTLDDVVEYSGLIPGKEYTLKATLMDKTTGAPVGDAHGGEITAEKTFTPEAESGKVTVTFNLDSQIFSEGSEVVVFESLYRDKKIVGFHTDINDGGQTVAVDKPTPEIETTATDALDGDKTVSPADEQVTINDHVCYTKLRPGKEYEVSGVLMDKATGAPLAGENGQPITATKTFTPTTSEGCEDIPFTVPGKLLLGKTTVVFEHLYREGTQVAIHADINDENQTIYTPTLKTTATDKRDGDKLVDRGLVTVSDKVCYSGLTPGREYTIQGRVFNKTADSFVEVDGAPLVVRESLTPDQADGCVSVDFQIDTRSVEGATLVVFETLTDGGGLVAVHEDPDDEGQTVTVERPDLPYTGANAGLLAVVACALLGTGAGVYVVSRRRTA